MGRRRSGWTRFKTPGYQDWRLAVFAAANWQCQQCGRPGNADDKTGLDAHHRKSYRRFKALRLDVANGVALCRLCHQDEHRRRKRRQGRWT